MVLLKGRVTKEQMISLMKIAKDQYIIEYTYKYKVLQWEYLFHPHMLIFSWKYLNTTYTNKGTAHWRTHGNRS